VLDPPDDKAKFITVNVVAELKERFQVSREERSRYRVDFDAGLHIEARRLHRIGGLFCMVGWIWYALDTDPKLHPEFPELVYFRFGFSPAHF